jgi:hypothetical protein
VEFDPVSRFDVDEYDPQKAALWAANTRRALRGKQGRKVLAMLEAALLELPDKALIEGALIYEGAVCALGALAVYQRKRLLGADEEAIYDRLEADTRDFESGWEHVEYAAGTMGMSEVLACAIAWANDEGLAAWETETPRGRYDRMLAWVRAKRTEAEAAA